LWVLIYGACVRQEAADPKYLRPPGAGRTAPHLMSWITILVELLGGFAVMVGAFVAFVSIPLATVLLVAIFTVHLPYGSVQSS
jgi:uncharacterized membrane protein YphA (DoxX/SURF4 family)